MFKRLTDATYLLARQAIQLRKERAGSKPLQSAILSYASKTREIFVKEQNSKKKPSAQFIFEYICLATKFKNLKGQAYSQTEVEMNNLRKISFLRTFKIRGRLKSDKNWT